MTAKTKITLLLLLPLCSNCFGQIGQYSYLREIKGITKPWHTIILPDQLFGKVSPELSDLRIYGITTSGDTVEAPYLLRRNTEKTDLHELRFQTVNTSHNEKGYYFTFDLSSIATVNQISLEFKQQNFDWRIQLEGSQNQQEWFTLLENYRILSVKNEWTDYQFAKIVFPNSKYRFYRLRIPSKEEPDLRSAKISEYVRIEGALRNYPLESLKINNNKLNKQTEIDIDLSAPVPVSHLKITVSDTFDYYRPVTISYLFDSIKTEQGWKYNYRTLTSGTLNSIEENRFQFSSTILQKLKITVRNQDNQALTIDTVEIKGYVHELVARFTEPARYVLAYGKGDAQQPDYDIDRFAGKIPETLAPLELGVEQQIAKVVQPETAPLFKNKIWLWAIMTAIMLLLGWFMVDLIRKN